MPAAVEPGAFVFAAACICMIAAAAAAAAAATLLHPRTATPQRALRLSIDVIYK